MADDGSIHLISMDLKCKSQIPLGETSLVQVLSHDLIKWFSGMELLIATSDGTLMCLATGQELAEFDDARDETLRSNHMLSLTSVLNTSPRASGTPVTCGPPSGRWSATGRALGTVGGTPSVKPSCCRLHPQCHLETGRLQ